MAERMRRIGPVMAATFVAASAAVVANAQPGPTVQPAGAAPRQLVVATKETPPFAMKNADGTWSGISIELWQHIAADLKLDYRLVEEPTVKGLLDGAASGRYDAAIAALTITGDRAGAVDFSQPYYASGLGIAVPYAQATLGSIVLDTIASLRFLQAVGALIGLALLVGFLIWVFERRKNDNFSGGAQGIGASIWWSAEAMTQASTGVLAPITLAGRTLAIVWMVGSIIAIAIFTAGVTSALTTRSLQGLVTSPDDLARVRVGAVTGTETLSFLDGKKVARTTYPSPAAGLDALEGNEIDAFVYDKPLLAWMVLNDFSGRLRVLDATFDPQNYGIALPVGSPLRREIDIALLDDVRSDWWRQILFQYLGER